MSARMKKMPEKSLMRGMYHRQLRRRVWNYFPRRNTIVFSMDTLIANFTDSYIGWGRFWNWTRSHGGGGTCPTKTSILELTRSA